MNFLPTSLVAAVLALAIPASLQSGRETPKTPAGPARVPGADQIVGMWRLVEFDTKVLNSDRRAQAGYLMIADGFLSFECHIAWMDSSGSREASTFFSGTHEYQLGDDGVLTMTQLIGTTMNPTGQTPVFEQVGRKREYKARLDGARLVLVREQDDQTFKFEKMQSSAGGLDFYGRRKEPAKPTTPPTGGEKR